MDSNSTGAQGLPGPRGIAAWMNGENAHQAFPNFFGHHSDDDGCDLPVYDVATGEERSAAVLSEHRTAGGREAADAFYFTPKRKSVEEVNKCTCDRFELTEKKCKSWFCEKCCVSRGLRVRQQLIKVLATFTHLQMLTLTIDPKLFPSPKDAFNYVKKKRCLSELVRTIFVSGFLESRRWFCVLEFQKKTEMPHFHLIIETGYLPIELVREAWGRFRPVTAPPPVGDAPSFGHVRYSQPKFANAIHAAHYACKYLIKAPKHGYPEWVLLAERGKFKRYTTSRDFWPREKKASKTLEIYETLPKYDPKKRETVKASRSKTIGSQVDHCCKEAVLLAIAETIAPDGEIIEQRFWNSDVPQGMEAALELLGIDGLEVKCIELSSEQASVIRKLNAVRRAG